MPGYQGRYWIITSPKQQTPHPRTFLGEDIYWIKGQEEVGASGYEHYQWVCHTKRMTLKKLKGLIGEKSHIEATQSKAAEEYVWKEDTRVEGTQFEEGSKKNAKRKIDWDDVREKAITGQIEDIDSHAYISHYRTFKMIYQDHKEVPERPGQTCELLYGKTGCGKSHNAYKKAKELGRVYWKANDTKWWDGYDGEEVCIIDDFSGHIPLDLILRWIDWYPCRVEVKGGMVPLEVKHWFITSNNAMDTWYPDESLERNKALRRRVSSVTEYWVPYRETMEVTTPVTVTDRTVSNTEGGVTPVLTVQEIEETMEDMEALLRAAPAPSARTINNSSLGLFDLRWSDSLNTQ